MHACRNCSTISVQMFGDAERARVRVASLASEISSDKQEANRAASAFVAAFFEKVRPGCVSVSPAC